MSAVPLASPVEAYFEVANRCNSKCATCPLTFDPQERAHNLTFEEFVKLVEQLPHLKRAVMHGIGEPLLNRDLPSMVRHLKQRDVYVLFNSNAALLTDARQRALIDCGLDEFRVSIDGSTPETYIKVRGIAAFELVIANVAAMVHLKRELGETNPRISFWVTGMRENLPELPGVIELAARIGVDEVYLQRMVFSNIGLAVEEQSIFRGYREEAERIIAEAETLADRLGVTFRGSGAPTLPQMATRCPAVSPRSPASRTATSSWATTSRTACQPRGRASATSSFEIGCTAPSRTTPAEIVGWAGACSAAPS